MRRRFVLTIPCVLVLAQLSSVRAEDGGTYRGGFQYQNGGVQPPTDDGLYRDLGGSEKITAIVKDFVGIITTDSKIGKFFDNINPDWLAKQLTHEFIDLSGGPVKYTGPDVGKTHKPLGIADADFNRLVECLQTAMDRHDVPFATQNRFLALLAPMHRVVVTK